MSPPPPGSNLDSLTELFVYRQEALGELYLLHLGRFIDDLKRQGILSPDDAETLDTVLLDATNQELDLSTCTEEVFLSLLAGCYASLSDALIEVLQPPQRQDVLSSFEQMMRQAISSYWNCPSAVQILSTAIARLQATNSDAVISDSPRIQLGAPPPATVAQADRNEPLLLLSDLVEELDVEDLDEYIGGGPAGRIDLV